MSPISNNKPITPPATPTAPTTATPITGPTVGKPGADFAVNPVAAPAATASVPSAPGASSLPALRGHIQAALRTTSNPDAVVRTVVERRVDEQFGAFATPQMKASVVQQLSSDPHFVSTLHRLVREVSAAPTPTIDSNRSSS